MAGRSPIARVPIHLASDKLLYNEQCIAPRFLGVYAFIPTGALQRLGCHLFMGDDMAKRILLVDDSPSVRRLIKTLL